MRPGFLSPPIPMPYYPVNQHQKAWDDGLRNMIFLSVSSSIKRPHEFSGLFKIPKRKFISRVQTIGSINDLSPQKAHEVNDARER